MEASFLFFVRFFGKAFRCAAIYILTPFGPFPFLGNVFCCAWEWFRYAAIYMGMFFRKVEPQISVGFSDVVRGSVPQSIG